MKASQALYDFLIEKEGLQLKAYLCPAGVWTIGVGATLNLKGHPVYEGEVITKEQAMQLLRRDVARFEKQVSRLVQVSLTQSQFDALVSFVFNLGGSALENSTLLKKLNKGDYKGAAKEFDKWVYAGKPKKKLSGLVARRAAERKMFEQYGGEYYYAPDPNNEPLRNRDLPLPTVMREREEITDKAPIDKKTIAAGGVGIAGAGAAIDLAVQATPVINAASYLSWQTAVALIAGLVIIGGIWYLLRKK